MFFAHNRPLQLQTVGNIQTSFVIQRSISVFHVVTWAVAHSFLVFHHPLWVILPVGKDFL